MKKAMLTTALAALAVVPAMTWADCDFHNQAAMAQMASAKPAPQASSVKANASATPALAKASVRNTATRTADKAARSTSKPQATTTVVAKSN